MTTENSGKSSTSKSARTPAEQPRAANGASLVNEADIQAIATFRYAIRRFLRFSEHAARKEHITPQQHQLLLAIKGFPNRDSATVSELAHRLQMRQHSVVGLIDRTVRVGLVRRERGTIDRREVYVFVTSEGDELLDRLTNMHRQELATMREALNAVTA